VSLNKGWLEKRQGDRVVSLTEVSFHRVGIRKIPRQKGSKIRVPVKATDEAYYVLDKKVKLGDYTLSGNAVFTNNEQVVVQLVISQFQIPLRLFGKLTRVTSFIEYKRLVYQGHIQFQAVHKGDFERLILLDEQRRQRSATHYKIMPPGTGKLTFNKK
jgi:hypothetical protein